MRDTFVKTLFEIAKLDPRIMLITGDLGFGVFEEFSQKLPQQFINAGVAEQNMTLLACGLASEGFIPFTYSIGNFSTARCYEMIRNDAAYHDANVKIVSVGGGFSYGPLGMSHHATEDIAIMRAIPNVTVVAPTTLWEVEEAVKSIVRLKGVAYLRLDKDWGQDQHTHHQKYQIGSGRIIRDGDHCCIVSTGGIISEAMLAAEKLTEYGLNVCVVSLHTIKPLDEPLLKSLVIKYPYLVTLEEHSTIGGLGSAVAECFAREGFVPKRFNSIGIPDVFVGVVGSQKYLRQICGLDADSIVKRILLQINHQ
jgi:transketolase